MWFKGAILKSYRFNVKGLVQGVGFRNYVEDFALRHKIDGYVKNLPDRSVEACANLDDKSYDVFLEMLKMGPRLSRVEEVAVEAVVFTDFKNFEIRY